MPTWTAYDLPLIRVEDPTVIGRGDLAIVLAPGQSHRVGLLAEEHHGGIPEGAPATTGTVASIKVVRRAASTELEEVAESEAGDGAGFLVELAVRTSGTPVR